VAVDDRSMTGPAPLDPALRAEINEWCRSDIERLAEIIDRDLSDWLEPASRGTAVEAAPTKEGRA
jgi:hypothetical protein